MSILIKILAEILVKEVIISTNARRVCDPEVDDNASGDVSYYV